MAERRQRVLRFCEPSGDLIAAEAPSLVVYDATGHERFRTEVGEFLDIAQVGGELWVVAADRLNRFAMRDGAPLGSSRLDYIDPAGKLLVSSTAPQLAVWHSASPFVLRAEAGGVRAEVPGPGGDLILPVADGRWLLWQNGQLRLWRQIGEAWRKPIGDQSARVLDAQLVLDGRLFVLAQQRPRADDLRLTIAAVSDGSQHAVLRMPHVQQLAIAARRGVALARTDDRLAVFDLRFGRLIRELVLPAGTTAFAVDDSLQRVALASADGLELVRPDSLVAPAFSPDGDAKPNGVAKPDAAGAAAPADVAGADDVVPASEVAAVAETAIDYSRDTTSDGAASATATAADDATDAAAADAAPDASPADDLDPLPDEPLVRLDPVSVTPDATAGEIARSLELQLQLVGAQVHVAIAEAWDTGRIVKPDQTKPPFVDEVVGLLQIVSGRAQGEVDLATGRLEAMQSVVVSAERERGGRLTPLEVLAREFQLTPTAISILFVIAAPRLRGDLARLYGILANDPGRPLVDEHLLTQIFGPGSVSPVARELDADRPLRRYGLVRVGTGERPFAALSVDTLVSRYIANQPADGEPDHYLTVRQVDRDLEELQLPRALIVKALRFLEQTREEPARIAVRGRTGSGRHTLLASLASRAGRALGVIDLSVVPRESGRVGDALETMLRRAKLRGVIPCVDGLELVTSAEDPDTKLRITAALRAHPGPLAVRLPSDAAIPLEPGYLALDLPVRDERARGESWSIALERHGIELTDPSELAARYRVGPGIIERVCTEVVRQPDPPTDASSWVRELDDAVRQHLENRLGTTATRVTRLASWADVVLPEDITDSLLELTSRVRHRKQVFEQWGFDKSITSARGITALFQGSPGTGKTMVAGVLARDLGLEMYRVDVSRITSKWIGETEKNLGALFDAAEDGQVMLLFDEADSLFAKRTEVKTSVDRYSNMEVNYLLQRLDSFEGIAILTTNFGNSIDPAFKRRLTYRVTFPFPDEEMREQLWRSLIPPQVPITGTIDFAGLSQRFRLSGGYIRNAALRAAFLAAEEGTSLTHEHLERAIRMEFREIGKLAETGTLE